MSWLSQAIGGIENHLGVGGSPQPPTPLKLGVTPGNSGAPNVPGAGGAPTVMNQQSAVNAAMQNPDLSGVLGTIASIGGDVAGFLGQFFPKNADGSINWGGIAGDIGSFLSQHKGDILAAASVYESAQRQGKADKYGQMAIDSATKAYDAKAPLRDAGIAGMLDPSKGAPDLSALKLEAGQTGQQRAPLPMAGGSNLSNIQTVAGSGSGNPFAKALPMAQAPQMPQVPKPAQAPPLPMAPPSAGPPDVQHPMTPPNKPTLPALPIGTPGTGLTGPGAVPGVPPRIAPPGTAPGVGLLPGQKPPQGWALPMAVT